MSPIFRFSIEPLAKLAIQPNLSVQAGWQAAISGMIGASKP
jgi:hypothetical protein